jgi:acid phosphatase type 7
VRAALAVLLALALAPAALAAQEEAVLVGAGEIAGCAWTGDEATAALLDDLPGTVFTTGDDVYVAGTLLEHLACYEPGWGRHKARTRPAPGNHDHQTAPLQGLSTSSTSAPPPARPTRGTAPTRRGRGTWSCSTASAARSAASDAPCTAAVFHYPMFNSGGKGRNAAGGDLWRALHDHGAELVLSGDEHVFERFAPLTPDGTPGPRGIRQFTVGTGGALPGSFRAAVEPASEARIAGTPGVLELALASASTSGGSSRRAGRPRTRAARAATGRAGRVAPGRARTCAWVGS